MLGPALLLCNLNVSKASGPDQIPYRLLKWLAGKIYVCSDISHERIHHKIIPVPFRQPSTVFQPTGFAGEADHVEPGSVPSSLTCNRLTLASTRRGFAHKIVPNGVQLWRQLCSPLGVPPDDDDDDIKIISTEAGVNSSVT